MTFIVKLHKSPEGKAMLAVCDAEIAGKYFEEGDVQLDLSSNFYKGEEMSEPRIKELFKVVNIINLAGENSINLGIHEGIIEPDHVKTIAGIPHAQCVKMGG